MSAQWLSHFRLSNAPFSKEIDDAHLWVPSSQQTVVDDLVEACSERDHVMLTGEPGVGKTCVLRALRKRLPEAGFRLTYCHNATLGRRDFYRQLCLALGLSPKASAAGVFYEVSSHIKQLGQERTHPVFLLDESHLLRQDVLDHPLRSKSYGRNSSTKTGHGMPRASLPKCSKPSSSLAGLVLCSGLKRKVVAMVHSPPRPGLSNFIGAHADNSGMTKTGTRVGACFAVVSVGFVALRCR